jgi:outer membrane protein OmpA-like peptidoglycan-associated protein
VSNTEWEYCASASGAHFRLRGPFAQTGEQYADIGVVEKADVLFAFNQSTLTPEAKAALNQMVVKIQSLPAWRCSLRVARGRRPHRQSY